MEPQLSLPFKWREQKRFHSVSGVLAQRAAYGGGKTIPYARDVHNRWQALLAEFLNRNCWFGRDKNSAPPLFVLLQALVHSYVRTWRPCTLRGRLFRFRWSCSINSRWKEVRRIRRGESFHSSQVRVPYTHVFCTPPGPPWTCVNTHKKDKQIKKPYIFFPV